MALQDVARVHDPLQMMKIAQTIETLRTGIDNNLKSIREDADLLKNLWEGESANAYQITMEKLDENSPIIVDILQTYAQNLNDIAAQYLSNEQKLVAKSEALSNFTFVV